MSDHGQCYVGVVFIVFCFLLWGGGSLVVRTKPRSCAAQPFNWMDNEKSVESDEKNSCILQPQCKLRYQIIKHPASRKAACKLEVPWWPFLRVPLYATASLSFFFFLT